MDTVRSKRDPLSPLPFPEASPLVRTSVLALALTGRRYASLVLPFLWRHVVLSTASHLNSLLSSPVTAQNAPFYDETVRCDILVPLSSRIDDIPMLVTRFVLHSSAIVFLVTDFECRAQASRNSSGSRCNTAHIPICSTNGPRRSQPPSPLFKLRARRLTLVLSVSSVYRKLSPTSRLFR